VKNKIFSGLGPEISGDASSTSLKLLFHFANGDEVPALPANQEADTTETDGGSQSQYTVLAKTEDSPCVAVDWGRGWVSTQFHPEASDASFKHWVDNGVVKPPTEEKAYRPLDSGRKLLANFLSN